MNPADTDRDVCVIRRRFGDTAPVFVGKFSRRARITSAEQEVGAHQRGFPHAGRSGREVRALLALRSDAPRRTAMFGGALGFADPDCGIGYGYVTSRMGMTFTGDRRDVALRDALYAAVRGS